MLFYFILQKENFLILEDIIICFSHKQRDYFRTQQLEYWILLIQQNPFSCTQFSSNKNILSFFNRKQICNCLLKNKQKKNSSLVIILQVHNKVCHLKNVCLSFLCYIIFFPL